MSRIPLYYTFGNHMHWVDMQWLWGYHVLPGSIRDMLHFCRETGAKGNVNFDGIGYEKLAAEDPEALAELREAVQVGMIEPVGCSYGQPYGLFHGGESNIRQRVYGARTVRRLLGVWPKTFWEEEFDFFPQLPQMLRGTGFEYASLFFQWTWHTPEVPKEDVPVIWWEGQDGSRLLCATRNKLNLHQWPEDMDATFAELASSPPVPGQGPTPLILQWLELMPSPDWMCRSELILPKMRELLGDERFEIRFATLGEYLQQTTDNKPQSTIPVRNYGMDDVWHGMSLGKNGDNIRERSRRAEEALTSYESLFSILSLFGRPYAQWDVYPTWELEEGWRKLLSAQHHDNDECEGLCAHVAKADYAWIDRLTESFWGKARGWFREEMELGGAFNPNSWEAFGIEPFGFGPIRGEELRSGPDWNVDEEIASFENERLRVVVDLATATILEFTTPEFPDGIFSRPMSLLPVPSEFVEVGEPKWEIGNWGAQWRCQVNDFPYDCTIRLHDNYGGFRIDVEFHIDEPLNGGFQGSLKLDLPFRTFGETIRTDTPYGVVDVEGRSHGHKKYPTGDWMTSPQWFEEVKDAFVGLRFVDFSEGKRGVMVRQDSAKQWFRSEDSAQCVMASYDPWDENRFDCSVRVGVTVIPHGNWPASKCWKVANTKEPIRYWKSPKLYSALSCDSPNVVPTALYRETEDFSGKHVENYAGKGMGYPFIVRLVEFDGLETEATLTVAGTVAAAYKTSLLGQIEQVLQPRATSSISGPDSESSKTSSREIEEVVTKLQVSMRPYEIATIYMDIVEGRKQTRDLDAKREIWATVHRVDP